ncbi:purple acid phosphatase [Skeletonema marinoi]|uniref:Purple acid phosphatase n=1 Tax=Skeletonema marinoi TaxID=267567 RepID=A0AAD9D4N8_9STRA|nr:purple acid phosphatase [Skeletonema marinoi]
MDTDNIEEALSEPLLSESSAGQPSGEVSPAYSEFGDTHPEQRESICSIFGKIPTIAYILASMVIFIIVLFLAAGLMPLSTQIPPEYNYTNNTPPLMNQNLLNDTEPSGPKGIHISLTESPTAIHIQFSTTNIGKPVVEIAAKDNPSDTKKHDGESTTYLASDMCVKNQSADSTKNFVPPGQLHTIKVTDLKVNTDYVYRAGISTGQGIRWGDYINFRTSKPAGFIPTKSGNNSSIKPAITFLALADQGVANGTKHGDGAGQNVTRLITSLASNHTVDSIHIIGDLSYADGSTDIWDKYMDMIEPFASRIPTMVAVGNHEYDYTRGDGSKKDGSGIKTNETFHPSWGGSGFHDEGGECGVPFAKRFAAPNNGNSIFWYSFEQSLVHTIMLSSEHNMTRGSAQYKFLKADLSGINRTITPWVVVELHRPMYNSEKYATQDAIGIAMRYEIEELLHLHHVDLVLSGHYHAYLRSCDGLYQEKCSNGGPQHVTVGTGGAPLDCDVQLFPNHYTKKFDEDHFGVGRVTIYNASALLFEFVALGEEVVDDFWILRQRS